MLILLIDLCSVGVTCVCYVECDDVDGYFCSSSILNVRFPPPFFFCLLSSVFFLLPQIPVGRLIEGNSAVAFDVSAFTDGRFVVWRAVKRGGAQVARGGGVVVEEEEEEEKEELLTVHNE